jgi:hypothetical protein
MAITAKENTSNYSRLQAISGRVSRQIALEALYRAAKIAVQGYDVDIPLATVNAMKAEFVVLRTEIQALENNITA